MKGDSRKGVERQFWTQGYQIPKISDKNDPNYESEEQSVSYSEPSMMSFHQFQTFALPADHWLFNQKELKIQTRKKLQHTISSQKVIPFVEWVKKLDNSKMNSVVCARIIQIAIEQNQQKRRLMQILLDLLFKSKAFSSNDFRRAFWRLYLQVSDLSLDNPEAPQTILEVLKWTIQQKILPFRTLLEIPLSVFNLGRGDYVLGNFKWNQVPIGNLLDQLISFKQTFSGVLQEYLNSGVQQGVLQFIQREQKSIYIPLMTRKIIEIGLEKNNRKKQLCCKLVARLGCFLQIQLISQAFQKLIWNSQNLSIDIPTLFDTLPKFIARAIIDQSLPSNFLSNCQLQTINQNSYQLNLLLSIQSLVRTPQSSSILEHIWAPNLKNLADHKKAFDLLVQEFFDSFDFRNVQQRLRDMCCPHYMHEFCKKLIELSMDRTKETIGKSTQLLKFLLQNGVVLASQLIEALKRLRNRLEELKLDVPRAEEILGKIEKEFNDIQQLEMKPFDRTGLR